MKEFDISTIYKKLHVLEKELIQINGLMLALQKLLPDGNVHTCVANELEERLGRFNKQFYEFWEMVSENDR
ncbi:hypothetical protein TPENAI_20081 [Tenacibaculum litopenaei]|uniref:hypothetical protein n=1 Tax=Tenacibaculum litopenaei TaxID=396016 RepID=UPI003895AF52